MRVRAILLSALALGLGETVVLPQSAHADGIERPRARGVIAPRRARPAARPAPQPAPVEAPPPVYIAPPSRDLSLPDSFFQGPLTGGVGYAYGAGGAPGGGSFILAGGGRRFSGFGGGAGFASAFAFSGGATVVGGGFHGGGHGGGCGCR